MDKTIGDVLIEVAQQARRPAEYLKDNHGFTVPCEYLIACVKQRTCEVGEFSPSPPTSEHLAKMHPLCYNNNEVQNNEDIGTEERIPKKIQGNPQEADTGL